MRKLLFVTISVFLLMSCHQNRPIQFERTKNTFTISNRTLKMEFSLDSIPGAILVNDIPYNGKLGWGGTAPMGLSGFYLPQTRGNVEIVDWNSERIILHESYNPSFSDSWKIMDAKMKLDRQLTLYADSSFLDVFDYYYGEFDKLHIATALPCGMICGDTAIADIDGLRVSIHMDKCSSIRSLDNQIIIDKEILRNEPVNYRIYFEYNAN